MARSLLSKPDLGPRNNGPRSKPKSGNSFASDQMMFYADIFGSIPKYTPPSYTSVFADALQQQIASSSFGGGYVIKQKASVDIKGVPSSPSQNSQQAHTAQENDNSYGHESIRVGRSEGHGRITTISYADVFGDISSISAASSGPEILSDLLGNEGNHLKPSRLDIRKDSLLFGEELVNVAKPAPHTFTSSFKDSALIGKDKKMHNDSDGNVRMARSGAKKPTPGAREEAQKEDADPSFFDEKLNHRTLKPAEYTYSTCIEKNHVLKHSLSSREARKHRRTMSLSNPNIHKPSSNVESAILPIDSSQPQRNDMFWVSIGDVKLITEPSASPAPARPPPSPGSRTKNVHRESFETKIQSMNVNEARGTTNASTVSEELVVDVSANQADGIKDVLTCVPAERMEGGADMLASSLDVANDTVDASEEGLHNDSPRVTKRSVDEMRGVNDGSTMYITKGRMGGILNSMSDPKTNIEKIKESAQMIVAGSAERTAYMSAATMDMKKEIMDVKNVCIINASKNIPGSKAEKRVEGSVSRLESAMDMAQQSIDVTKGGGKATPAAEIKRFIDIHASTADRKVDEGSKCVLTSSMGIGQESIDITKEVMGSSQMKEIHSISTSVTGDKTKVSMIILQSSMDMRKEIIDVRKEGFSNSNEAAEEIISEVKEPQRGILNPNNRKTEEEDTEASGMPQSEHTGKESESSALENLHEVKECRSEEKPNEAKNQIEEIEMVQSENGAPIRTQKETEEGGCQGFRRTEYIPKLKAVELKIEDMKTGESKEGESEEEESEDVFLECENLANEDGARESVLLGGSETDQEAKVNENGEKLRNEGEEVEMALREKEPDEILMKDKETQRHGAKENFDRIKPEARKVEDSISQRKYLGKNDKARENLSVNFITVEEGKGTERGGKWHIGIMKAQEAVEEGESNERGMLSKIGIVKTQEEAVEEYKGNRRVNKSKAYIVKAQEEAIEEDKGDGRGEESKTGIVKAQEEEIEVYKGNGWDEKLETDIVGAQEEAVEESKGNGSVEKSKIEIVKSQEKSLEEGEGNGSDEQSKTSILKAQEAVEEGKVNEEGDKLKIDTVKSQKEAIKEGEGSGRGEKSKIDTAKAQGTVEEGKGNRRGEKSKIDMVKAQEESEEEGKGDRRGEKLKIDIEKARKEEVEEGKGKGRGEQSKVGTVKIQEDGNGNGRGEKSKINIVKVLEKAVEEGKGNGIGEQSKIYIVKVKEEAVEEGKSNGRDERSKIDILKAQDKYQEMESQRYYTKESMQRDASGLKNIQGIRLHLNGRGNEIKEKADGVQQIEHLRKKDKAKEDGTMAGFRPEQAARSHERGEKQGKGREERVRIEKDKEMRERHQKEKEERDRQREREKDRLSVQMFTREAHERARERERANAETWERAAAEARGMKAREAKFAERASTNSLLQEQLNATDPREKVRAALSKANAEMLERSIVERAASEARARAMRAVVERAKSDIRDRASSPTSVQSNRNSPSGRLRKVAVATRSGPLSADTSFPGSSASVEFQETEGEPAERRKARLERHQRAVERAAKALEEKNERDRQMQREQAERHRIAQIVDMDIKRWVAGKEGNLRALLSTLQYILWRESGWQPIPLTDLLLAASVKKAYRKATLCVHPDKVQQKGATIQQKYVAEKVFDLLKEAWTKFSSDEML